MIKQTHHYIKIFALVVACGCLLAGCGNSKAQTTVLTQTQQNLIIDGSLAKAASQASESLQSLALLEKSKFTDNHPDKQLSLPLENIHNQALDENMQIQWYGPAEPILQRMANKTGYKLQVYGKTPQLPVLVNIDTTTHSQSSLEIIRNIDVQCANKAKIFILPKQRVISLRYIAS